MYEAVSHLIELGHVRIGFILSGFEFLETVRSVRERFDAYRRRSPITESSTVRIMSPSSGLRSLICAPPTWDSICTLIRPCTG